MLQNRQHVPHGATFGAANPDAFKAAALQLISFKGATFDLQSTPVFSSWKPP